MISQRISSKTPPDIAPPPRQAARPLRQSTAGTPAETTAADPPTTAARLRQVGGERAPGNDLPSLPGWGQRRRQHSPLSHRAENLRPAPRGQLPHLETARRRVLGPPGIQKLAPSGKLPAKTPKTLQSVGELLDSSVPRLGQQSFEGHGVRPVDKAFGHGGSALGVGPGVFSHVYAFKHLGLLMAILVLVSWLKSLRSAGLCVA
jgi:hypothetical protein